MFLCLLETRVELRKLAEDELSVIEIVVEEKVGQLELNLRN